MPAMHVINQDRDNIYPFNDHALCYIAEVMHNGLCIGYNLMMGSSFLGTFESEYQAEEEMREIISTDQEIHVVSGFSNWDDIGA